MKHIEVEIDLPQLANIRALCQAIHAAAPSHSVVVECHSVGKIKEAVDLIQHIFNGFTYWTFDADVSYAEVCFKDKGSIQFRLRPADNRYPHNAIVIPFK